MRGRQLKVYLHPKDRPLVDAFVREELASALLKERSRDRAGFETRESKDLWTGLLICPRSLLAELDPRYIEARDEWIIDVHTNPVVEWWFSKLDSGLLYPGRFYYVPSGFAGGSGRDGTKDFLVVADKLFKWLRTKTCVVETEWGTERLGPVAAEMVREGQISLRRNPPGSRI